MDLKDIYAPVKIELEKVEKKLHSSLANRDRFIAAVGRYVLRAPGKRLRPALVLLSAKIGRANSASALNLAAAIELIHTATLIHDDLIDAAKLRRKQVPVNIKFGGNAAILYGDYLYARAFEMISGIGIPLITERLVQASSIICQGEMRQIGKIFGQSVSREEYFEIVADKTAALFSACCEAGGILAGAQKAKVQGLKNYGYNLGVAFQIVDDCLDLAGDEKKTGKSGLLDAKIGKLTLPYIYMRRYPKSTKSQAVNYSVQQANLFGEKARNCLPSFKDLGAQNSFNQLVDFVLAQVN